MTVDTGTDTSKKPLFSEAIDDLTGYDERAIEANFGFDVYSPIAAMADDSGSVRVETLPVQLIRALIFAHKRRENGGKDSEALKFALGMRAADALEFFDQGEDEPMPEDPVTESGKDARSES